MPRKSAAQTREPASLPEVLIPPSQAESKDREAYWLSLLAEPDNLKAAVQTEEFWPMLQDLPDALWTSGRTSLYLYRQEDDEGRMVKNAEGKKKYIKIFHAPIDEEIVSRNFGGGKYKLYLKLDHKLTLTEYTFAVDGVPKVFPGQVVEIEGKPVSVAGAPTTTRTEDQTDVAKVIDANAQATEKIMGMMSHASEKAIDMIEARASASAAPQRNPLDDVKALLEIVRQPAPAPDPVQQELMKQIIAKAFAEPKAAEVEERETPIENTLAAIKELSGGLSLAELMKPAAKAAAADPIAGWAPIVSTIGGVVGQFLEKFPQMQAQRNETLRLEYNLRVLQMRQPGQALPELPAATAQPAAAPQPKPQIVNQQPAQLDPAQVMNAIVAHIVAGFKKPPVGEWGEQTAAAMDFHFSDAIDAMSIADTLGDPGKVAELVAGIPVLAELSKDGRWKMFQEDVSRYCADRWGNPDDEKGKLQSIDGEKPPAA